MRVILKPMGFLSLVGVPIAALITVSIRYNQVTAESSPALPGTPIVAAPLPAASAAQRTDDLHKQSVFDDLMARKVDRYTPSVPEKDTGRNFTGKEAATAASGNHVYRHATHGGSFSMDIWVDSIAQNDLVLTYWGADGGGRTFDIFVNDIKIATQSLDGKRGDQFSDVTYTIPLRLTQSKEKVRLRLQAAPNQIAGGVWDMWVVKRKESDKT